MASNNRTQGPNDGGAGRTVPHIGAFVLETLTLGMYGEPRHTLREYVQNSFDSIRAAQRLGYLRDRGLVSIAVDSEAICLRDNGLGVAADHAWKTLTSIGASKKDRIRDAGFRGIGRLAGMAYCEELIFRTSFPDEPTISTVSFNCNDLLGAMNPDGGGEVELARLLDTTISFSQETLDQYRDEHFFEVQLRGLSKTPTVLKDAGKIHSYLAQTVPVSFDPVWKQAKEIEEQYKTYFGIPLETIDVTISSESGTKPVQKPYGDVYQHSKGTMKLEEIEYFSGKEGRYWAWVGRLDNSAAVTDRRSRGLRVRVRNIQVDGTEIVERMFSTVKPSYGRFSSYYVGEIHIDPNEVVPNARRDGFEELDEWLAIQASLSAGLCRTLASDAYEASRRGVLDIDKVLEEIQAIVARAEVIEGSARSTYDHVVDLMTNAKRYRKRLLRLQKTVDDIDEVTVEDGDLESQKSYGLQEASDDIGQVEDQARMLIGRFLDEDERLEGLKARLREQIIREVLDVINAFVDPTAYRKIKEKLVRS